MSKDRVYFKCEKGGDTEAKIFSFREERQETIDSWRSFADKYSGDRLLSSNVLEGIEFNDGIPEGWKQVKKASWRI